MNLVCLEDSQGNHVIEIMDTLLYRSKIQQSHFKRKCLMYTCTYTHSFIHSSIHSFSHSVKVWIPLKTKCSEKEIVTRGWDICIEIFFWKPNLMFPHKYQNNLTITKGTTTKADCNYSIPPLKYNISSIERSTNTFLWPDYVFRECYQMLLPNQGCQYLASSK